MTRSMSILLALPIVIAAIAVTLVIAGPWMLTTMLDYMHQMFTSIPSLAG